MALDGTPLVLIDPGRPIPDVSHGCVMLLQTYHASCFDYFGVYPNAHVECHLSWGEEENYLDY